MKEKDDVSEYRIEVVADAYYGFLRKDCTEKEVVHRSSNTTPGSILKNVKPKYIFHIEKCKTCPLYETCSENAAATALRWYEGSLMRMGDDRIYERLENARKYLEYLKEGRGEYRY